MKKVTEEVRAAKFQTVAISCDFCGELIRTNTYGTSSEANLSAKLKVEADVSVERMEHHGSEGSSVKKSVDCCADCFEQKVIPVIEATFPGVKFQQEECDW